MSELGVARVSLDTGGVDPMDMLAERVISGEVRMTMIDGRIVDGGGEIPAEVVRGFRAVRAKLGLGD